LVQWKAAFLPGWMALMLTLGGVVRVISVVSLSGAKKFWVGT
jgi:hypothetical protein